MSARVSQERKSTESSLGLPLHICSQRRTLGEYLGHFIAHKSGAERLLQAHADLPLQGVIADAQGTALVQVLPAEGVAQSPGAHPRTQGSGN